VSIAFIYTQQIKLALHVRRKFSKQYCLLLDYSMSKEAIVIPQQDPLQGIVAGL
jgi:hypothetical protein